MMRGATERQAWVQLVQHARGLVQPTQTQPPAVLRTPQVVLPSVNHYLGGLQLSASRWYSCLVSPPGGESCLTPPQKKLPPPVVQVHRTMEDLQQEGGETVADPSVTPGGYRRRLVCSRYIRRAICPLGQRQVFHH